MFDRILAQTVKLFDIQNAWIAMDGTGHACTHASLYYAKKLKKQKRHRREHYTKNYLVVETDKQAILTHKVAKGPRYDSKDAIPALRKAKRMSRIKGCSADKAHDAEPIHKVIREELKAEPQIPLKQNRTKTGKYRLKMSTEPDESKYHRRSLVETVISVEKRGDVNYSRSDRLRNKECKLRNICYNVYRYANIFIAKIHINLVEILVGFLQS